MKLLDLIFVPIPTRAKRRLLDLPGRREATRLSR
jgi:hypothetical protein